MDGHRREVHQAECASNASYPTERRAPGATGADIRSGAAATAPPGPGTTFGRNPAGICTKPATRRDPAPEPERIRVKTESAATGMRARPGPGGGPRRPGCGYIRSIIALPKPEHETCVAPCISRAKS